MHISPLFKKAVTAAALAAVAITPIGYTALRYERGNNRYAECVAEQTGGKAGYFSITDMEGQKVAALPLLRPYGLDHLGLRPGIVVHKQGGVDTLSFALVKSGNDFKGAWDFVRVGGQPLPTGSYGRGDIVPNAAQSVTANYALFCANNRFVQGPLSNP